MVAELLKKYLWLVQTFQRAGSRGLSLAEISDRWERRFDSPYSRRTFNNHRKDVEEVFGIYIDCNRSTNRYFIESSDYSTDENSETAWLINSFTVRNMLSLGKERLSGRISVENIPSGHKYLTDIMDAMTENRMIRISYQKYTSAEKEYFTVHPYAVKEFSKRWYLIAFCEERNAMRVYGLDRVKEMEVCESVFNMPDVFDVDELFATSFGIYLSDEKGMTIKFRTSVLEAKFLIDLPVHESQTEIERDDNSVTFSIFVYPDINLIMEFCKYGDRIEILSPQSVRNSVSEQLRKAADIYKNDYKTK